MAKKVYVGVAGQARKVKAGYVGVEQKARKIKKGYLGVGGVARPFWGSDKVEYHGPIDSTGVRWVDMGAASAGRNAVFMGGSVRTSWSDYVVAFTPQLAKVEPGRLSVARGSGAAATVGQYAIFCGGGGEYEQYEACDAYSSSLVRTPIGPLEKDRGMAIGCSMGDVALVVGGYVKERVPNPDGPYVLPGMPEREIEQTNTTGDVDIISSTLVRSTGNASESPLIYKGIAKGVSVTVKESCLVVGRKSRRNEIEFPVDKVYAFSKLGMAIEAQGNLADGESVSCAALDQSAVFVADSFASPYSFTVLMYNESLVVANDVLPNPGEYPWRCAGAVGYGKNAVFLLAQEGGEEVIAQVFNSDMVRTTVPTDGMRRDGGVAAMAGEYGVFVGWASDGRVDAFLFPS